MLLQTIAQTHTHTTIESSILHHGVRLKEFDVGGGFNLAVTNRHAMVIVSQRTMVLALAM